MLLIAWRNLVADRIRLMVTLVGIAFAVMLMIFEGSLLVGFVAAASNIVDATDADIWVTARGVRAFDLPAPLPDRFRDVVRGVDGVESAGRLVAGFTSWSPPSGQNRTVLLVGADRNIGGRLPSPRVANAYAFESVVVDRSSAADLEAGNLPVEVEIGSPRRRAIVRHLATGFGTFLGPPYVFTGYDDGVRYLGWSPQQTAFIAVRLRNSSRVASAKRDIAAKLPEVDVWSTREFAWRSSSYWLIQTGAGGALLTAAVLGLMVGLVIVAQNMYAITLQHIEEFATLKALGASNASIAAIVSLQALISGAIGTTIGIATAAPGVRYAAALIPWIVMPGWLVGLVAAVGIGMCLMACLIAIRPAMSSDPATVFRA
ncbi:MAG TPA: ABC transporter permease [Vicinamibacterales bacterium]|nr:ABC transporter permease [Vicinamibacterales bacterium]